MKKTEAIEWIQGSRSMVNMICRDPWETLAIRSAQADAAMKEQAYWALRAYEEFPSLFGEDGYEVPTT